MILKHYGTPRHSGRYPWGSGEEPQRSKSFVDTVKDLKKEGLSELEISKALDIKISDLRGKISYQSSEKKEEFINKARKYKEHGYRYTEIGRKLGVPESTVRGWLKKSDDEKINITKNVADVLKNRVKEKEYLDVGYGIETQLGVTRTRLKSAITLLKDKEQMKVHKLDLEQVGTGKKTQTLVLTDKDHTTKDCYDNKEKISMIKNYSEDGGRSMLGIEPPRSISSKKIHIKYKEDGGDEKDGVIELRRGVKELDLGSSNYAQVRIAVDDKMFLKGMALYSDDIPSGKDAVFYSTKKKGTPLEKVLKPMIEIEDPISGKMVIDMDNPFKSTIRQKHYIDSNGEKKLSALNIVREEGEWEKWSKHLSSQMLSKQPPPLAQKQLDLAYKSKLDEYEDIMKSNNPSVRKKLLAAFSDSCDSDAVELAAASLPRQGSYIILPFPKIKSTEVYAPNFKQGETVVLIRHPHGGIFEIPQLKVNNNIKELKGKHYKDAVGIHPDVAKKLSGADFDGDTVIVIPNPPRIGIKTDSAKKTLMNFDPKIEYPPVSNGQKIKKGSAKEQSEMGKISNLITDMTIKGAIPEEIIRAVRHSMVVIDSAKHGLDYKRSYDEHGIAALKKKYQGGANKGASTLISKASSQQYVDLRKQRINSKVSIDPKTGKKIHRYYDDDQITFTNKDGKLVKRKLKSTKMAEIEDALELSSGTKIEEIYGNYANSMKSLGNKARKSMLEITYQKTSDSAKRTYTREINSLKAKLELAIMNKPLERAAQRLAAYTVKKKVSEKTGNYKDDKDGLKKLKTQALAEARRRLNPKRKETEIIITPKEWEAIQAGAITKNFLASIIDNTKLEHLKVLSMPKQSSTALTPTKIARIKTLASSGYTRAEIAETMGVSTSTVAKVFNP